jgi:DNA-binding transcriptional ArsR family regulator
MTATSQPLPSSGPAPSAPDVAVPRLDLVQALLDTALQAQRNGTLDELVRTRPRAARWLMRRHDAVLRGSAGDAVANGAAPPFAAWLLRWLVTQLRPDAEPGFDGIADEAWLQLPGWRPMLATASIAGWLRVPDFPRHYRRRLGEPPLDNLCGLWGVGPSTIYRTLERARHLMALALLDPAPDALRRLSLRRFVLAELSPLLIDLPETARAAWHLRQAAGADDARDAASALWHRCLAGDVPAFVQTLRQHAGVLATAPETEALVERVAATGLTPRWQVDLWLARAALARTRDAAERELRAYEQARHAAQAAPATQRPLLLGIVHSALGKYYEPRDADRAFACYQDSADFLCDLGPDRGDVQALEHFLTTFARLAWLYLLRNDARSKAVLDRAEALRAQFTVPDDVAGMLERVWSEYWRRAGDRARSMEHCYRALNIFERLGDQRSVLATRSNLVHLHGEAGDAGRAIDSAQVVFDAARRGVVEPALLVSTHLNLGLAWFWQKDLAQAIEQYRAALAQSLLSGLRLHAFRARYNLAEAHYMRCRDNGSADDERKGDSYIADALAAPESDSGQAAIESARKLKQEVLGARQVAEPDRLLPGESAVHFEQMAEVQRQRLALSVPGEAGVHARAHLAIARAYMDIAAREREAARALVAKAGLQPHFVAEFDALRLAFERELTREQQLAAAWKLAAGDLVDDGRRTALIAHLLREGAVNKSGYGELCGVAPATASKHLGLLAERGLLVQRGKGPSTRYELAA